MSFHIVRRFWNLSDKMMSLTIFGVKQLANERKIQLWLPFLNKGQLHRTKITSSREQWNWTPNEKVVVILPIPQRKLSLHQFVILELQELPKPAMFPMKNPMRSRANVELWLKIGNMGETDVHCIWLKERLREPTMGIKIGAPQRAEVGTAFQNRAKFLIRV